MAGLALQFLARILSARTVSGLVGNVLAGGNKVSLKIGYLPITDHLLMIAAERTLTLSMGQGRGYINGITFTDMDHASRIESRLGTDEVWEVVNNSGMDHPFHQHVNPSQILAISGGDAGYAAFHTTIPAWKDTVLVPKGGKVTMLVPVKDYGGMAMFHCHIIEHEDIGMMGVWEIM